MVTLLEVWGGEFWVWGWFYSEGGYIKYLTGFKCISKPS